MGMSAFMVMHVFWVGWSGMLGLGDMQDPRRVVDMQDWRRLWGLGWDDGSLMSVWFGLIMDGAMVVMGFWRLGMKVLEVLCWLWMVGKGGGWRWGLKFGDGRRFWRLVLGWLWTVGVKVEIDNGWKVLIFGSTKTFLIRWRWMVRWRWVGKGWNQ